MFDDERANTLMPKFAKDLIELTLRDAYQPWPHVVITGLLNLAAVMMRNGVEREPDALPVLLAQLDQVRAIVQAPALVGDAPDLIRH
jgi:hypothetical protein